MPRFRAQPDTETAPDGAVGTIRLWSEHRIEPIVVYVEPDTGSRLTDNLQAEDRQYLGDMLTRTLKRHGVDLSLYQGGRIFHLDLRVPPELIARYSR